MEGIGRITGSDGGSRNSENSLVRTTSGYEAVLGALEKAHLAGFADRRCPSPHPELAVDGAEVVSHGVAAQVEALRHLRVGQATGDAREDLYLAGTEDGP